MNQTNIERARLGLRGIWQLGDKWLRYWTVTAPRVSSFPVTKRETLRHVTCSRRHAYVYTWDWTLNEGEGKSTRTSFFFHATAKHNKVGIVHSLLSFLSMYLNSKTQHTSETWDRCDGITDPGTFRAMKTTPENEAKPDKECHRQEASKARDEIWLCKRRYKKSGNRLLLQIRRLSRLAHGVNSRKLTATKAPTESWNKRRKTQMTRETVQEENEREREKWAVPLPRLRLRFRLQSLNPNPNPRRRDLGFYVLQTLTLGDKNWIELFS